MGASCCNKEKAPSAQIPAAPELPPSFRLVVTCEDLDVKLSLNLSPDLPLSAFKDMILRKIPEISFKRYLMTIGNKELADDTASLRQLLIQSGDIVKLERVNASASVSVERRSLRVQRSVHQSVQYSSMEPTKRESEMQSRGQMSLSEVVESEDHIRHEAANSRPTHAMLRGRLRDLSNDELKSKAEKSRELSGEAKGKRLWETAMRGAPPHNHVRLDELDMSSTTNRSNEYSLKERYFPTLFANSRIQEHSVVLESDESYNGDENRVIEKDLLKQSQHPKDFFQELQGLYSSMNKI